MSKVAKKDVDFENGRVVVTPEGGDAITLSLSDYPEEIINKLALHGLSQKAGDSYAGAGQYENPADMVQAAVERIDEQLKNGEWSTRKVGGGGAKTKRVVQALARSTGKSVEEAQEAFDSLDEDNQKKLRKHPEIQRAMAEIRAEEAAAKSEQAPSLSGLFE